MKGAPAGRRRPYIIGNVLRSLSPNYMPFAEHFRASASQMPPACSHSAWFCAVETSPAKAGPAAKANSRAIVETKVFITFSLTLYWDAGRTQAVGHGS